MKQILALQSINNWNKSGFSDIVKFTQKNKNTGFIWIWIKKDYFYQTLASMKKANIYQELKEVLARLKPFEAEVAGNYLVAFDRNKKVKTNKAALVFETMLKNPGLSYDALKAMVSPELNKYDFNKFLIRLRNKLFDSFLLDLNITRQNSYSDWFRARLECTKNWILVINLLGRGNQTSAMQLLRDQIKKCEQFELYDLMVSALYIQMNSEGLSQGEERFNSVRSQVQKAEKCRDANYKALEWNTRYYAAVDRKASQNEQVSLLMEALSELQELYEKTNTAIVGQYSLYFEMEYYQTMGDYQSVKEAGLKLIELIESRPALKSEIRLSGAYANLAFNDILLYNFDDALENIDRSFKGAGLGSYNHVAFTTLKAQAQYFKGDIEASLETTETILQSDLVKVAPYEKCKLQYIKGCILFNQQQFFKAYNVFNSENILMDSDPEGWNVGIRLMCILCLVEMQLDELADLSIESLRKHMSRTSDERNFKARDKAILKILRSLERNSFDFAKTYFKNQQLFFLLQSDEPEYSWKIKSHEHIVFHEWFQSKLAEKHYQFRIPEVMQLETADKNETKSI